MTDEKEALKRTKTATRVTIVCLIGNVVLSVFKMAVGILSGSAAMVADAFHSFSDMITDFVLIAGVKIGSKPIDSDHPYGHGKYETLAALIISVALFIVAMGIFYGGARRIIDFCRGTFFYEPSQLVLWTAVGSFIVKEIMYRYTVSAAVLIDSPAMAANAWHHRSDAFSSLVVVAGVIPSMIWGASFGIADPAAAILVGLMILRLACKMIKSPMNEFLESGLSRDKVEKIRQLCLQVDGVKNPHDIKTRKIGFRTAVDLHIDIAPDTPFTEVHGRTEEIERLLRGYFGPDTIVNVHPEPL